MFFVPLARFYIWQGRDDAARPLASGLYFARLVGEGFASILKLTLTK